MAGQVHPAFAPPAPAPPTSNNGKIPGATVGPLPPPATYSKPHHRGGLAGCCCCLCATLCSLLLALLFLCGAAILIVWLILKPIDLPNYTLDSITINNFRVDQNSTTLDANLVYNFTANNPNRKIGIYYDTITLETSYDAQVFGDSNIPAFYQGHQNITRASSELNVKSFQITASSATTLAREIQENRVPIHVRADAEVRLKIGSYKSPDFWVRVDCDLVVGVMNPSSLISKSCRLSRRAS